MGPAMDFDLERERILRRRKLAEAMLAQSQTPLGGTETVSGIAVRRSPLEGIAKIAQAYSGVQAQNKADDEARGLGQKQRDEVAAALADYEKATTARPGSSEQIVDEQANGGEGAEATITAPAFNPGAQDRRAAAMALMGRVGDPKDAAKMMVAEAMKTPELKAFKPGDVLYSGGQPTGTVIPDKPAAKPSAIQEYEFAKGQGFAGTFEEWQKSLKKAGASNVTATANAGKTEQKYGEQFAGAIAKQDVDLLDAARKAPELATRANQVKEILSSGKVITGAGADYRLALGKALNLAGASDAETIANTEALSVNLARNTLDAIKASGLGSGSGFSNADRDFLEKAAGGKINLEGATIGRLADLSHRAADLSAGRWNSRVKDIPDSALSGTGIKRDPITVSPLFGGKKPGGKPQLSPEAQRYLDAAKAAGQ